MRKLSQQTRDEAFAEVAKARRIVVKVGSAILAANDGLADRAFTDIARQISEIADSGRDVVLVSFDPEADLRALPGFGVVEDRPATDGSALRILHLVPE